ncbi:selenocysteine-specific translation elongation factor [Helicobacter pametensis]|uniref:selenocysteine-specific translation elongation factor n=1 Tax=Helicobacter pametensis TaxID=95149 RepID=UPI0004802C48|nr:selenocysteine-specific translation elongation factor [Helicobacter pametensis]
MHNDLLIALGGHIDHGKTSFIKALNGFDGDERDEEKQRGITLDISFSNLTLPKRNIAFIDVPGHEKLIKHMVAGAFGVDLFCLIIAGDDGIMPQTLEHLQIANFLGIPRCICIITKTDKITSQKQQELSQDITKLFQSLQIHLDQIFPFSLISQNDDKLAIIDYLAHTPKPPKKNLGFFRYYIDRSFSISGAGCVVSGSVLSGEVKKGDKLLVYDLGREVTVRSLKIHSHFAQSALPSQRAALNLHGISSKELKRGYLLAPKGYLRGFDTLEVILHEAQTLPSYATLHIGAKKINVKITILSRLAPSLCLARLKSDEKIFAIFKERFILRSDHQTLCGGEILSPITDPIKKSQKLSLLQSLYHEDFLHAFEILTQAHPRGFGLISSTQRFGLSHTQALQIAHNLKNTFVDDKNLILYHKETQHTLQSLILQTLQKNPKALLSASSLHIKYPWASEIYLQHILDSMLCERLICNKNGLYTSPNNFTQNPQDFITHKIYEILDTQGYAPLAPYNIYDELGIDRKAGDQSLKKLCASQKVVRLEHNLFVTSKHLNTILKLMRQIITQQGYIDLMLLKAKMPLSRKYLIAYLDYLDRFEDIQKNDTKRYFKHQRS